MGEAMAAAARISVREAVAGDAARIAELSTELAEVLRRAGNPVAASLSEDVILRDGFGPSPAFACLVADSAVEGLVGYALLHPAYDPDLGGRIVVLVDLYVRRSARRQGVGTLLVGATTQKAVSAGARALSWWIREGNRGGISFYRALGAEEGAGLLTMHLPLARG